MFFFFLSYRHDVRHTYIMLGSGWERGKFYLIVMIPMAKLYYVLASGSTRRLDSLIIVYCILYVCSRRCLCFVYHIQNFGPVDYS